MFFKPQIIVLAVGPLLRDAANDFCLNQPVNMIIPGLAEISSVKAPNIFKAFLSGRLSTDAKKIKQAQLGIAGFATAIRRAGQDSAYPNALKGVNEPALKLRGVEFEYVQNDEITEAEKELNRFAQNLAGRVVNLQSLPFTTKRKELFTELASASVAMMPSWHEGFGLVAWEAIAAGVPLILSEKSGVYKLLLEHCDGMYVSFVWHLDIEGNVDEPYFSDNDLDTLVSKIFDIAKDPGVARSKAARLRSALLDEFTWAACALSFGKVLGWQEPLAQAPAEAVVLAAITNTTTSTVQELAHAIAFLELPTPKLNLPLSDSTLLRAEEAVIAFDADRNPFLQKQMDWAMNAEFLFTLRLLAGPGGVGKTRLALELCQRLEAQGWRAGFLGGEFEKNNAAHLAGQLSKLNQPCCVVIDYAETRQQQLLALIEALLQVTIVKPIRLLLLARDGGDWWNLLEGKNVKCQDFLMILASGPFYLPALHDSQTARGSAYQTALNTFANLLTISVPSGTPDLNDQHFAHPLYVQMAALLALRGERPKSAEGLTRALIHHERRYWCKALHDIPGTASDKVEQAGLLMALATLLDGIATDRVAESVWKDAGGDQNMLKPLFKALAPLYPGTQGLQGLRPDLIGEELVVQTLISTSGAAMMEAIFKQNQKSWIHSALTVVARALGKREEISSKVEAALSKYFLNCIDAIVAVCVDTPSDLPRIVESAFQSLPRNLKWQASGSLQPHLEGDLPILAMLTVEIYKVIVEKSKSRYGANTSEIYEYAQQLINLAVAYDEAGNKQENIAHSRRALEIAKQLTPKGKMRHLALLAKAQGVCAAALGSRESIVLGESAITNLKTLVGNNKSRYTLELAQALANHAVALGRHGDNEQALKASMQAIATMRSVPDQSSSRYQYGLATALGNASGHDYDAGDSDQSVALITESINIFRELTKSLPNQFEYELASRLVGYARSLATNGEHLKAASELVSACSILKKYAELRPERFVTNYIAALLRHSEVSVALGEFSHAQSCAAEALQLARERCSRDPDKTQMTDLRLSLSIQAERSAEQGYMTLAAQHAAEEFAIIWQKYAIDSSCADEVASAECNLYLMQWLANVPTAEISSVARLCVVKPRIALQLLFNEDFVWACTCPNSDLSREKLSQCLAEWSSMDTIQRYPFSNEAVLLFAQAEHELGPGHAPKDWREQLTRYKAQRKGWMPWWMLEVARRGGYAHLLADD